MNPHQREAPKAPPVRVVGTVAPTRVSDVPQEEPQISSTQNSAPVAIAQPSTPVSSVTTSTANVPVVTSTQQPVPVQARVRICKFSTNCFHGISPKSQVTVLNIFIQNIQSFKSQFFHLLPLTLPLYLKPPLKNQLSRRQGNFQDFWNLLTLTINN